LPLDLRYFNSILAIWLPELFKLGNTMKPKMKLDPEKDIDGYAMIVKAASILAAHGFKEKAKEIHQKATIVGYNTYRVFRLLKEYMDV